MNFKKTHTPKGKTSRICPDTVLEKKKKEDTWMFDFVIVLISNVRGYHTYFGIRAVQDIRPLHEHCHGSKETSDEVSR